MIRVSAELRLRVRSEDGIDHYDVTTTAEDVVFDSTSQTRGRLVTVIRRAASQGLEPLRLNYAAHWLRDFGPDEISEIKRRAKGWSLSEARTTPHVYDDGEMVDYCLLCGQIDSDALHVADDPE